MPNEDVGTRYSGSDEKRIEVACTVLKGELSRTGIAISEACAVIHADAGKCCQLVVNCPPLDR